jgi:hypothetical protein
LVIPLLLSTTERKIWKVQKLEVLAPEDWYEFGQDGLYYRRIVSWCILGCVTTGTTLSRIPQCTSRLGKTWWARRKMVVIAPCDPDGQKLKVLARQDWNFGMRLVRIFCRWVSSRLGEDLVGQTQVGGHSSSS